MPLGQSFNLIVLIAKVWKYSEVMFYTVFKLQSVCIHEMSINLTMYLLCMQRYYIIKLSVPVTGCKDLCFVKHNLLICDITGKKSIGHQKILYVCLLKDALCIHFFGAAQPFSTRNSNKYNEKKCETLQNRDETCTQVQVY